MYYKAKTCRNVGFLAFFFTYERDISSLELEREVVLLLVLREVIMVGKALEVDRKRERDTRSKYVGKDDVREY